MTIFGQGQSNKGRTARARRDWSIPTSGEGGDAANANSRIEVRSQSQGVVESPPFSLLSRDWLLQLIIALFVIGFSVSTLVVKRHNGYNVFWDGWEQNIAFVLPIIPMLLRANRSPDLRTPWNFMAAGGVLNEIGSLMYTYHSQHAINVANVKPTAVSFLLTFATFTQIVSYLAFIIGVALLTQGKLGKVHASLRLDGLIAGLALASMAGMLWFQPLLQMSSHDIQVLVTLAFPLCDLTLLVLLVAGLAANRYRPTWPTSLLLLGVLWFIIGDVVSLNQAGANNYVGGTFLDATWVIGIWLMGLAASVSNRRRTLLARPTTDTTFGMTLVPVASGVLSVGVIGACVYYGYRSLVISFLALASLILVISRMWMTLHEERQSAANFQDARTDALTGLRNRRSLLEEVELLLEGGGDGALVAGMILIDLNGFKEVNDALGHAAGDELLCVLGRRFESRLEGRGMLARLGGDEFAFTCRVTGEEELVAVARNLLTTLVDPCMLDGVSVRVGASMGVAVTGAVGSTAIELLRSADVAMYDAKRMQNGIMVYRADSDPNSREQLALLGDLRDAIDARSLTLHYQPTLDMRTGKVRGVEALARWEHPVLGMLQPDTFIPMAERAGLMPQLTRAVLVQAVTEAARLDRAGHHLHMSVNISRYDLVDEDLPDFIEGLLTMHEFPPNRLTLEITESTLGSDPNRAAQCVNDLRTKGVRISIDDFGVGYSSMSQLLGLAIDELKIDKSFIIGLCGDPRAQAIVRSAIELASALDLSLVAEGIEDKAVLQSLQGIGADIGQGFFIALPLQSDELDAFLADPDQGHQLAPSFAPFSTLN